MLKNLDITPDDLAELRAMKRLAGDTARAANTDEVKELRRETKECPHLLQAISEWRKLAGSASIDHKQ